MSQDAGVYAEIDNIYEKVLYQIILIEKKLTAYLKKCNKDSIQSINIVR